jgi:two-component system chemotaxis sensor kinase CheA
LNLPDSALLAIFTAEQAEHVRRMREVLRQLDSPGSGPAVFEELLRRAHTLKGAARAAGFEPTELLMHALEGAVAAAKSGKTEVGAEMSARFTRALDATEDILASAIAGRPAPDVAKLVAELSHATGAPKVAPPAGSAPPEAIESASALILPQAPAEFIRVNAAYLDELMSASSELAASAGAAEIDVAQEERVAAAAIGEWNLLRQQAAPYLRRRRHDPDFAPVIECVQAAERQLSVLAMELHSQAGGRRRREWELRRLADRLDESALRVRMVATDSEFGGFGPMVRSLAEAEGKQVEFHAEGMDLQVDRLVLQTLKDPVMHLLRNAVSHGIEEESRRLAAGKPAAGTVSLTLQIRGDRLLVTVQDDGPGVDRRALAGEAARLGISPDTSGEKADPLAELAFQPGVSTSSSVTTISGRGMGLSAVREEVSRLHGDVRIDSRPGRGTAITISTPVSVSSQEVLLISAAGHTFGIPASFVQLLLRVRPADIQTLDGKPAIVIDSMPVGLARMTELLELPGVGESNPLSGMQAVVIAAGGHTAAILVDRLLDVRDSVIKPTGLSAGEAGLGSGAIPLPDGTVAVILNVAGILDRARERGGIQAVPVLPVPSQKRTYRILVADDSITTRSLEKSLLEANGYEVRIAVDGMEALEKLHEETMDLVISDLMMPRMDGFQLLEHIRRDQKLAKTPFIIVSSMESREDQERGLALGADAFIVKRKFDQRELLETVRQIL